MVGNVDASSENVKANSIIRVGGVVGENSFKFFIQFVAYTALYCTFVLIVLAIKIHEIKHEV